MKKNIIKFIFILLAVANLYAQEEEISKQIERYKRLKRRLEKKIKFPSIEDKTFTPLSSPPLYKKGKIFIKNIELENATFITHKDYLHILKKFENRYLSFKDLRNLVREITNIYRQKGFITSFAYLPPQKIKKGRLKVKVLEAKMGKLRIEGNKFFKKQFFKRMFSLRKGAPFNYYVLRQNILNINEHPDLKVQAFIIPGEEFASTDVVLKVRDNFPFHLTVDFDNFGTRFIREQRYACILRHTNFLGFGDILSLEYRLSQAQTYIARSLSYVFPLKSRLKVSFNLARSKVKLGRELREIDSRSKSRYYSLSAIYNLIYTNRLILNTSMGLDYKDVYNYLLSEKISEDRVRVLRAGLDLDLVDKFGRSILIWNSYFGIPKIMGGLDSVDKRSSRGGSGGKFIKSDITFLRLHKLPLSSYLLFKTQFQFSSYNLPSCEQYLVGGISNMRGYPPAQIVGDRGGVWSAELYLPVYLMPKQWKVPFFNISWYETTKLVIFYDWGWAKLKNPLTTEEKKETVRSAGFGLHFNLPEELFLRLEFGYPLDKTPKDEKHFHLWVRIYKTFNF